MLELQPENAALRQTVQGLLGGYKGDEAVKAEVSQLSQKAVTANQAGHDAEAREAYLHGIALLLGKTWTQRDRFAASLSLMPARQIADDEAPLAVSLTQTYSS